MQLDQLKRRQFITLLGGAAAAAWPLAARAQRLGKVHRIGFLWDGPTAFPEAMVAFREQLRDLGYVENRNLLIEYRWAEGKPDQMRAMAEELVRLKVDAIIAPSSIYTTVAMRATPTIPIVFFSHADPFSTGDVANLARPGGNATGLSLMMTESNIKLLELLKDAIPALRRDIAVLVAVIYDPATPSHEPSLRAVQTVAPALRFSLQVLSVHSASDYDEAFVAMTRERADAVLALSAPFSIAGVRRLAELALAHKLPSMFGAREHVEAGGLMSYGADRAGLWRRGAIYVDRILKGAKPVDLPVEQPTKFELAVNLKTAKALGLTIPEEFLLRADKVVE